MAVLGRIFYFVVMAALFMAVPLQVAHADDLFVLAGTKAVGTFNAVKGIIFVVGGFGLVGIAYQAIFGRMNWKWFAGLAFGLAIVAASGSIVHYASGDYMDTLSHETVNDTFAEGMDGSSGGYSGGSGNGFGGSGGSGGGSSGGKSSWWGDFWNGFKGGFASGYNGSGGSDFSGYDLRINN